MPSQQPKASALPVWSSSAAETLVKGVVHTFDAIALAPLARSRLWDLQCQQKAMLQPQSFELDLLKNTQTESFLDGTESESQKPCSTFLKNTNGMDQGRETLSATPASHTQEQCGMFQIWCLQGCMYDQSRGCCSDPAFDSGDQDGPQLHLWCTTSNMSPVKLPGRQGYGCCR